MADIKLKGINLTMAIVLIVGIAGGIVGRLFKAGLSEFSYGFITGISITFIVAGLLYFLWQASKGNYPFKKA